MTTVQVNPTQAITQATSPIRMVIDFFVNYWGYIVSLIVIAVTIGIAYAFYSILKKERLERDSEAYANYNNTVADCKINCNKLWVKANYSFVNLFWLGIPFKVSEHSAKLIDADRQLMGYYRGHFEAQDGTINYLVYKNKFLGIFEEQFLIKIPKKVKFVLGNIRKPTHSKTKNIIDSTKYKEINFKEFLSTNNWNYDIQFQAIGVQKISQFYRTPNFIYKDREVIDLRQHMLNTINDDTWRLGWERMVNLNTKITRKAVEGNPYVQSRKQGGEIEQDNQEIEKEEEYK